MRGDFHIADILRELGRNNLLPAIVFRTARTQCDTDVLRAVSNRDLHLDPARQRELRQSIHEIVARYDMDMELITSHPHYNALLLTGVGAHHAGQLLMWRLLLEEVMAFGLLRILVATGTVAAGVDFPARTVVITAHSKRGAEGFKNLTSAEFQQMSGRAGRRGKDTVGFCLVAPAPFCDARQVLRIARRPPEPLTSAYFPSPSTVLNLLRYRNVDDLRFTVQRSLAAYIDRKEAETYREEAKRQAEQLPQSARKGLLDVAIDSDDAASEDVALSRDQKRVAKKVRRLMRQSELLVARQRSLIDAAFKGLESLGYVDGISLSEKGYWAANLCTSLVLELGEVIESGLVDTVSALDLATIVASISGDTHRKYLETKSNILSDEVVEKLKEILKRVNDTAMPGVSSDRQVSVSAAYTVLVWMQAEDWHQFRSILTLQDVAEGDAARLITQTADHLNQLSRLSESHEKLCFRAEEAKRRILRPPLTEALNLEIV